MWNLDRPFEWTRAAWNLGRDQLRISRWTIEVASKSKLSRSQLLPRGRRTNHKWWNLYQRLSIGKISRGGQKSGQDGSRSGWDGQSQPIPNIFERNWENSRTILTIPDFEPKVEKKRDIPTLPDFRLKTWGFWGLSSTFPNVFGPISSNFETKSQDKSRKNQRSPLFFISIFEDFWAPDLDGPVSMDRGPFKILILIFCRDRDGNPDLSRPWLSETYKIYVGQHLQLMVPEN